MIRVEALRVLDGSGEELLRQAVTEAMPDDADYTVEQVRAALESGEQSALGLVDVSGTPQGIAVWRWADGDHTAAEIDWLHVAHEAPDGMGQALVEQVWGMLAGVPTLEMIAARVRAARVRAARVRGELPGVREALRQCGAVIFERCLMIRDLVGGSLPEAAVPAGYRIVRWAEEHQAQVEAAAAAAHAGGIDEVVVIEARPGRLVESLRAIRAGTHADLGRWHGDASLVALAMDGNVAAYVAVVDMTTMAFVADLGVHPAHRRIGLGRLLMVRSMAVCREQGYPAMGLAVTTRNPVRRLYDRLGFRPVQCGETAIWWRDGRQLAWQD